MSNIRKFRIEEMLSKFTPKGKRKAINELMVLLDISQGHINHIRRASIGSNISLKDTQLLIISKYFHCTIEELINQPENTEV